ncbi:uncharacterized protein LOC122664520 [Telopea speciosissima]|uniref:uncharacterized protein LOC122664520 n=1 Tax=Telopea speciosissima TaxID=54955 RepID=UPI001CC4B8EF|nr:uncharacterized protein LOC122664520 [Telopea speciosissima]
MKQENQAFMQAWGTQLLTVVQERERQPVPPTPQWIDASKLTERFQKLNPSTFTKATTDLLYPAQWIRDMEGIFEVLRCTDEDKIRCAAFQFRGEVNSWWQSTKDNFRQLYPNPTWDQFTETFQGNYFPQSFRDQKEIEFMSLTQGPKSVLEYQQIFEELFYFAPKHMKPDGVKARKFEKGLRPSIISSKVLHNLPSYAEVVQAAKVIEDKQ